MNIRDTRQARSVAKVTATSGPARTHSARSDALTVNFNGETNDADLTRLATPEGQYH
ncbi:MAG TPA: hypothetical protein VFE17_05640 [Candidatus Baltobacteraceae bacterium]|nr:hypothetical protein [Candidatus Baltobacteraceae bacterium]